MLAGCPWSRRILFNRGIYRIRRRQCGKFTATSFFMEIKNFLLLCSINSDFNVTETMWTLWILRRG